MSDKIFVETTGNFMLLDITTGEEIPAGEAVEVTKSAFIEACLTEKNPRLRKAAKEQPAKKAEGGPTTGTAAKRA